MGSLSATAALRLPVRLHGRRLGGVTDILFDRASWHVLGFVVEARDGSTRFLPYPASQPAERQIAVASALLLLEDVTFYEKRGQSFCAAVGAEVEHGGRSAGTLCDLHIERGGAISSLVVEFGDTVRSIPPDGATVASTRASAA